ncbi:speckle-type POZ protein-like [Calliphora vicina]|uniref:speckle-type POZ protein-like n=1 Tax=Calliphora vicina TaxID=7373 RepID=UPI00325A674C
MSNNNDDRSVTSELCFKWNINYGTKSIESDLYSSAIKNLTWRMRLYPRVCNDGKEDQVQIDLCLESCENSFKGLIKYIILDRNGKESHVKDSNKEQFQQHGVYSTYLIPSDKLTDPANKLLLNNRLTISCRLIIMSDVDVTNDLLSTNNNCNLIEELGNMLENKIFSDVTLKSKDNHEFRAHKCILAARSDVFAILFETCKNNKSYKLDADKAVCEEMLQFIYTGNVSHLDELLKPLLEVANKYNLKKLKSLCENKLQYLNE